MPTAEESQRTGTGLGQSSWKERQRKEREKLIIQAAEEVLLEKGLHNVSMDEIAARVGISKGTLYLHFAKKEDLFLVLLEQELQACLSILLEITVVDDSNAAQQLGSIIKRIYQELLGRRFQLFYELHDGVDLQYILAKKREQAMKSFLEIRDRVRALLETGQAQGIFDPAMSSEVMVCTFFTMISPRVYKILVVDQGMSVEDLAGSIACIYLKGIAAP